MAAERAAICNTCDLIDREGSKCVVPLTQPCCSLCGCSLAVFHRSPGAACEAGKWSAQTAK